MAYLKGAFDSRVDLQLLPGTFESTSFPLHQPYKESSVPCMEPQGSESWGVLSRATQPVCAEVHHARQTKMHTAREPYSKLPLYLTNWNRPETRWTCIALSWWDNTTRLPPAMQKMNVWAQGKMSYAVFPTELCVKHFREVSQLIIISFSLLSFLPSDYVALASLECAMQTRLTSNSQRPACFCLLGASPAPLNLSISSVNLALGAGDWAQCPKRVKCGTLTNKPQHLHGAHKDCWGGEKWSHLPIVAWLKEN